MTEISLKYGSKTLTAEIPAKNFAGLITPTNPLKPADDQQEVISRALLNPIGSSTLSSIAKEGQKVAIIVDDHTRSTPTKNILPPILKLLQENNIHDEQIKIIFGTGTHRGVKPVEAKRILGSKISNQIEWKNHDCLDDENLVDFGFTSFKTPVLLNKDYVNADLKIITGDVCFHYYAGFGGGRKSILPGIAGNLTIRKNHSMLLNQKARTGILDGNPIHADMLEASQKSPPDFLVNVALTTDNIISKAWAGDMIEAWRAGVKVYEKAYSTQIPHPSDIVVVSAGGFPKDIDFYQAYKAMDNAINSVKHGGVMVLLAECREDVGNPLFAEWMRKYPTLMEATKEIHKNFALGGHKAFLLLKVLEHCHVVMVSEIPDDEAKMTFQLEPASTLDEALEIAYNRMGEDAKTLVLPDGYITLPKIQA